MPNIYAELAHFDELCQRHGGDLDLQDPGVVDALIEGETDLKEMASALLADDAELDILETGLKEHIAVMQARMKGFGDQRKTIAKLIEKVVKATPDGKLKLSLGTVYTSQGSQYVEIRDSSQIPFDYFKSQEDSLDKPKILADLKDGIEVPGCELARGAPSVRIRKK